MERGEATYFATARSVISAPHRRCGIMHLLQGHLGSSSHFRCWEALLASKGQQLPGKAQLLLHSPAYWFRFGPSPRSSIIPCAPDIQTSPQHRTDAFSACSPRADSAGLCETRSGMIRPSRGSPSGRTPSATRTTSTSGWAPTPPSSPPATWPSMKRPASSRWPSHQHMSNSDHRSNYEHEDQAKLSA